MFPNGVVYEGVSEEPMYFRGELLTLIFRKLLRIYR